MSLRQLRSFSMPNGLAHWGFPLALFLLALSVRLPALGQFLTADEFLWVDRSRNFLAGLINPAYVCESPTNHTGFEQAVGLACTLRTGHPGVTTMWTGSLGILLRYLADGAPRPLWEYVLAVPTNPLDSRFIAPTRLPTVLLTSLWVIVVYWLVWRLFGERRMALAAGLLLALDPFTVALSRVIHHDALSTTFMTLSLLMALIYWGERESRRWLVASGILAGFAFLSKSPALFLNPFIALIGLWSLANRRLRGEAVTWRHVAATVGDGLLWFGCAVAAFVAFWPAMWVIPIDALRTIFFVGSKYASGGHAKGNFFLGTVSQDPGVLFYPVTWLLRSTPLVWLGLMTTGILGIKQWKGGRHSASAARRLEQMRRASSRQSSISSTSKLAADSPQRYILLLLVYAILFIAFMTLGEKKQDRYILPVYPALSIVAAFGLAQLSNLKLPTSDAYARQRSSLRSLFLAITILIFQGALVVTNFPYYLTYYNPMMGGIRGAEKMVTVGWGEGLDVTAAYLNQKPDARNLRVSAWYQSTFAPFFEGEAISYSKEKGKAMAGDYVVFYINQLQRRFPDDELFRYFESRYQPEQVISLKNVDYAVIYPGPHIQHYVEDRVDESRRLYQGIAALLGWDWIGATDQDRPTVAVGGILPFRLYWEYLGKVPEERFFFRLLGADGRTWAEGAGQPVLSENGDPANWRQGQIITEEGELVVPAGTPPGEYQVQIGFYTQAPAVTEGELIFDLPPGEARVAVESSAKSIAVADLPLARQHDAQLAKLRLLGTAALDTALVPGEYWTADVYWQVESAPEMDYSARLSLVDGDGQTRWVWDAVPLVSFYPSSLWKVGEVVRSPIEIWPTVRTPGGTFNIELTLLDDAGRPLGQETLSTVHVEGRVRSFTVPHPDKAIEATFGDAIELVGFNLHAPSSHFHAGDEVQVALVWRALAPVEADYTISVQLLGANGQIYGQQDGPPLDGDAPTSTWSPGEVLSDSYNLIVADDTPSGEYQLLVGIYLLETGERLAVMGEGDAVALAKVEIQ